MEPNSYSTSVRAHDLMIAALLTAVGILIPMFMPIKVILGPASYTLASHLPIFLGMFLSPFIGMSVALGTTIGFWFGGFPMVIVLRALSHISFVAIGAYWIYHQPLLLKDTKKRWGFGISLNVVHALFEMLAVYLFTAVGQSNIDGSFWQFLFVFVGLGTFVHGMIDYWLACLLAKSLSRPMRWDFI